VRFLIPGETYLGGRNSPASCRVVSPAQILTSGIKAEEEQDVVRENC
jgi:hypothetical protein